MRRFLKEYFSFSRSETRVIVLLSALIIISFSIRLFFPQNTFPDFKLTEEDNIAIDSFIITLEKISYESKNKETDYEVIETQTTPVLNTFDPNLVTSGELEKMGFPEFIGKNLIRYRKAGGKFYQKSDFRKLYGVTDSIFNFWQEYLIFPASAKPDSTLVRTYTFLNPVISLNSADSSNLLVIRGIGPYFAGKIVSYRNSLGGYLSLNQLLEIRGMDTVRLENIRNQVLIDSTYIIKLNLNKVKIEDLRRHPYVSERFAESLLKYRQFAGSLKNTYELIDNHIISEKEYKKLLPYLTVE
jgi:DNA uptake protein ComE-like DNA-binding protein